MTDPTASFATPRVAAGALFFDDQGRVLLVHPTYKDSWDIPGGYVERGESPAAACRRELKEELGIDRASLRLINVDWAPNEREGDKMLFLFDCGDLGADEARTRLPADELDRWEWVDLETARRLCYRPHLTPCPSSRRDTLRHVPRARTSGLPRPVTLIS